MVILNSLQTSAIERDKLAVKFLDLLQLQVKTSSIVNNNEPNFRIFKLLKTFQNNKLQDKTFNYFIITNC